MIYINFMIANRRLQKVAMLIDEAGEIEGGENGHDPSSGGDARGDKLALLERFPAFPASVIPGCAVPPPSGIRVS